jgi:hypothetical protein
MMATSEKQRKEALAQREFQKHIVLLKIDLGLHNVPRRYLDCRVQLLELLVEQTGGSQLTDAFRLQLAALKKQVALRGLVDDRTAFSVGAVSR